MVLADMMMAGIWISDDAPKSSFIFIDQQVDTQILFLHLIRHQLTNAHLQACRSE
jgi:hypothetical protein